MKKYILSERVNLFEPNDYITMIVNVTGDVKEQEIVRAVNAAYSQNETTMSKVVLESDGEAYYEKMNQTGCKIYINHKSWRDIVNECEKKPFEINKGEFIRTYINAQDNECMLTIIAHHLVGDGKSLLIFIQDVMNNLAERKVTYKPMMSMDHKFLDEKLKFPFSIRMYIKNVNKKWNRKGTSFNWEDYYNVHEKYWKNHSSDIRIKTYTKTDLQRMKKCANDIGVTLNSYFITQLLKKYYKCKVVGIPISVREGDLSMSNQTSGISIKYKYKNNKTFEENARNVHKKIYKEISSNFKRYFVLSFTADLIPTLIDSVLLYAHGCYKNAFSKKMSKVMFYTGKNVIDLGVTNLTRIDIPCDYEKYKIDNIIFIPPKVSYAKNIIGISTFEDTLNVSYHLMSDIK